MPQELKPCWVCAICKHVWLKEGERAPLQCASKKCRSRLWNAGVVRARKKRVELYRQRQQTVKTSRTVNASPVLSALRKRLAGGQGKSADPICALGA